MVQTKYPRPQEVKVQNYPEIPEGSYLNFNDKTGTFQVYYYGRDNSGGRIKVSVGTINRDLTFSFSDLYLAKKKNEELQKEIDGLKELLKLNGIAFDNGAIDSGASGQNNKNEKVAATAEEKNAGGNAPINNSKTEETEKAKEVKKTVEDACEKTGVDARKESRVVFPFEELACVAIMSSLGGHSDAYSMSQYFTTHRHWLGENLLSPGLPDSISHDTFRTHLLMVDPKRFEEFYSELIGKFVIDNSEKLRVISFDGQAVRATGRIGSDGQKHGVKYLMNVFDTGAMLCLCHKLIPKKKNEISVGFTLLDGIDVKGAVITADALNTQTCFVNSILKAGADYCLAAKDNQEATAKELAAVFNTANSDHVKTHVFDCECGHGRVEQRTVKVVAGRFLSKALRKKWRGLAEGSAVMVSCERTNKRSRKTSLDTRYYISSLCGRDPEVFGEIVRRHWFIENKMHWLLDCNFFQDKINGSAENYLNNRSSLNNLALGILYRYRAWLAKKGEEISLSQLQNRMANPEYCIEAMAVAFGLTR